MSLDITMIVFRMQYMKKPEIRLQPITLAPNQSTSEPKASLKLVFDPKSGKSDVWSMIKLSASLMTGGMRIEKKTESPTNTTPNANLSLYLSIYLFRYLRLFTKDIFYPRK